MKTKTATYEDKKSETNTALLVTVMLGVLTSMGVFWQMLSAKYPVICGILISVLVFLLFALYYYSKPHQQKPLDAIKHNFPPDVCKYLPYALDRTPQKEHIKINLHNDLDKIWIIHGDSNQCHDPFLRCVENIYWDQLSARSHLNKPRIIHFDCPDRLNNFTKDLIDAIWTRIKHVQDYPIPNTLKDLSQLFEKYHDGPIILNTRFHTDKWKTIDKKLLYKLFFKYNDINKHTSHPLILCIFVIYAQPKSYLLRKKHKKRKKRIEAELKSFKELEVPKLDNIRRSDMDTWYQLQVKNNNNQVCEIQDEISLQDEQMNLIFTKDSLPMSDVADKLCQLFG